MSALDVSDFSSGVSVRDMVSAAEREDAKALKIMSEACLPGTAQMAAQEAVFLVIDSSSGLASDAQLKAINSLEAHVGISRQFSVDTEGRVKGAMALLNGKVAEAVSRVFFGEES